MGDSQANTPMEEQEMDSVVESPIEDSAENTPMEEHEMDCVVEFPIEDSAEKKPMEEEKMDSATTRLVDIGLFWLRTSLQKEVTSYHFFSSLREASKDKSQLVAEVFNHKVNILLEKIETKMERVTVTMKDDSSELYLRAAFERVFQESGIPFSFMEGEEGGCKGHGDAVARHFNKLHTVLCDFKGSLRQLTGSQQKNGQCEGDSDLSQRGNFQAQGRTLLPRGTVQMQSDHSKDIQSEDSTQTPRCKLKAGVAGFQQLDAKEELMQSCRSSLLLS
ncbi:hypothetical protein V6N13_004591 [Hibiscus sabdariffa]|uniref:Uncharacterized protein n=1 Tax=Hibiscus sabdariffa TaxID=183260 RepID=A0ABR2RZR6_9ROSI